MLLRGKRVISPAMLIARLPLLPADAQVVSPDLAVRLDDECLVVFNASGGLARPTALARALGMHPGTVFRYRQLLVEGGVEALRVRKRAAS